MEKNKSSGIPAKKVILKTYEGYVPYLQKIMKNIQNRLKENLKLSSQPTYKERIKSFNSYYKKLLRLKPDNCNYDFSLSSMNVVLLC